MDKNTKPSALAMKWGSNVNPQHASIWAFLFYTNFTAKNMLGEENPTREEFEKFIDSFDIVESEMDEEGNVTFYDDAKSVWIKADDFRKKAAIVHLLSAFLYYHFDIFKPILLQSHYDIAVRKPLESHLFRRSRRRKIETNHRPRGGGEDVM